MNSSTGKIGKLLVSIDNAVTTVFDDNACITHIEPCIDYKDSGVLLNLVIEIFKFKYDAEEYKARLAIFDDIVYNPILHHESTLSKIHIEVIEHE